MSSPKYRDIYIDRGADFFQIIDLSVNFADYDFSGAIRKSVTATYAVPFEFSAVENFPKKCKISISDYNTSIIESNRSNRALYDIFATHKETGDVHKEREGQVFLSNSITDGEVHLPPQDYVVNIDNVSGAGTAAKSDIEDFATAAQGILADSALQIADVIDNLTSVDTDKALSANQGKILKDLVDSINTLLASDDISLDEIQEIVDYIKTNRTTLESLDVSSIFGLQDMLDSKLGSSHLSDVDPHGDRAYTDTQISNITGADISVDDSGLKVLTGSTVQEAMASADTLFLNARSTGIRFGGQATNLGGGLLRISAGAGTILDNTDPENPIHYDVNWSQEDLDLSAFPDGVQHWIYVDSLGNINFTANKPLHSDYRTAIYLHRVVVRSGVISGFLPVGQSFQQTAGELYDIWEVLGHTKDDGGLIISANGIGGIHISSGQLHSRGANFHGDPTKPNALDFATQTNPTFRLVLRDNTQSTDTTSFDVTNYDLNGAITELTNNKWGIYSLFMFANGNLRFLRPQEQFNSRLLAQEALYTGQYSVTIPENLKDAFQLGWVIFQKGDATLSNAAFVTSNRFGGIGGAIASLGSGYLLADSFDTEKTTIVDGDKFNIQDSEEDDATKHTLWSTIKNTLFGTFLRYDSSQSLSPEQKIQVGTNLGLGDAAFKNTGTTSTTVSAGNHTHLSSAITDASFGGNGNLDANKLVKFGANGQITATTNNEVNGISGDSLSGAGLRGNSVSGIGCVAQSTSGAGSNSTSFSGTEHATFGLSGNNRSFIRRVNGAFGWWRGSFTGLIQAADTLTGNRIWNLPDKDGTVAMTTDISDHILATDPHGDRAYSIQRSNHTGTQTLATISDAGNAAARNVGTGPGDVAAGDHTHLLDALDAPGQTPGHVLTPDGIAGAQWRALTPAEVGAEDVTNKSTSVATDQASDTKYPSVKAVYDWALSVFQEKFAGSLANPSSTTDFAVFDNADGGQPKKVTWTSILSTMASAVQTLTNKTLTNPTINNYTEGVVAIGNSGTSQTLSLTNGTFQTCTLTANCIFTMPHEAAGKSFQLCIHTGVGAFTASFTGVRWPGGTAPTITAAANKIDLVSFVSDGTDWFGSIQQNF